MRASLWAADSRVRHERGRLCTRVPESRSTVATHAPLHILKRIEALGACGFCGSILKLPARASRHDPLECIAS
eukprot:3155952-Prymnesium_polylepis.1